MYVFCLFSSDRPPTPEHFFYKEEFAAGENNLQIYIKPSALEGMYLIFSIRINEVRISVNLKVNVEFTKLILVKSLGNNLASATEFGLRAR